MKDAMGIILTVGQKTVPPISDIRSVCALPMAGRFRLIDFPLSCLANAGITNVGVATTTNYSSLMDHLKSGKPWDLDRQNQGLNILPPNMRNTSYTIPSGDVEVLSGIYDYIRRSHQTYVVLVYGTYLWNIDIKALLDYHIQKQADITMAYKNMGDAVDSELSRFSLLDMDEDKRICEIEIEPNYPKTTNAACGVYVMERELLLSIIDECSARGDKNFIKDAINKSLDGLNVYGYEITSYMDVIDSMDAYYKNNMAFLEKSVRKDLLDKRNPIFTKIKDMPPTRYLPDANVQNSFISNGCVIEGTVENSILSRGVHVKKGAVVRNAILMQDDIVEENAYAQYVVFDKEVKISKGETLKGMSTHIVAVEKGKEI